VYSPKEYWSRLAEHGTENLERSFSVVLHAGAPLWFNSGIDRLQTRTWRRGLDLCRVAGRPLALDVGCGTGRWLRRYAALGISALGADATLRMLQLTCQQDPSSSVTCARAQQLPFPNASFDLVSSVTVIQHLPPDQQEAALAEMARVLRPGGHALLLELIRGEGAHIFPRAPAQWISSAKAAGLSSVAWFPEELLPLDRTYVWLAQRLRGRPNTVATVPLPGESQEHWSDGALQPLSKRVYWAIRRVTFAVSFWMEPLAAGVLPAHWATHGLFVFCRGT
jgi:SAM-dependent methyltransferase